MGKYPLERRKILKKTVQWIFGIITPLFLIVSYFAFSIIIDSPTPSSPTARLLSLPTLETLLYVLLITLSVFVILFIAIYLYQVQYFKNYFYDLVDGELVIRKGVFSTKQTTVPLSKIQDVYFDQDIFDRLFRLWDLHISSASGTSGIEAHIDGVNEINGRGMYGILLGKIPAEEKVSVTGAYSPSKAGLILMSLSSFSWLILGIFFGISLPFLFPIFILIFLGSLPLNVLEFNAIRYELRDDGVFIKKGFISPKESLVLYRNIQDVEETQNFLEIILGIKTLSVKTMTSLSALDSNIRYLSPDISKKLREEILQFSRRSSQAEIAPKKEISAEIEAVEVTPYRNHFIKSMLYSNIINFGILALSIALISLFLGFFVSTGFLFGILIAIGIFSILSLVAAVNAVIHSITYTYNISSDFISIKVGLFNIRRKQINYNKIQDLVLNISFPQSLAGLASLKLETGSKEGTSHKDFSGIAETAPNSGISLSSMVESVPDLDFTDAVELRNKIAKLISISLKGIGIDSLVSQFPLENIKPVKKTLWWVIYLTPIFVIFSIILLLLYPSSILPIIVMFITFMLILIGKYLYECEYYNRYFYDMNDHVLVIRKGVFGSREITIPFSKIQGIFVDQDVLDRFFNLRDLYVSTVTSRSVLNAHIDGVNPEKAEKIALMLIERTRNMT